jgi:hypothetical protein
LLLNLVLIHCIVKLELIWLLILVILVELGLSSTVLIYFGVLVEDRIYPSHDITHLVVHLKMWPVVVVVPSSSIELIVINLVCKDLLIDFDVYAFLIGVSHLLAWAVVQLLRRPLGNGLRLVLMQRRLILGRHLLRDEAVLDHLVDVLPLVGVTRLDLESLLGETDLVVQIHGTLILIRRLDHLPLLIGAFGDSLAHLVDIEEEVLILKSIVVRRLAFRLINVLIAKEVHDLTAKIFVSLIFTACRYWRLEV